MEVFKSKQDFEKLFKENYSTLHRIGKGYFKNEEIIEEIVCETFVKLWNNQATIQIKVSLKDYLVKSFINTCIDYYRKETFYREKVVRIDDNSIVCNTLADLDQDPLDYLVSKEQQEKIDAAIEQLPQQYKKTLKLVRLEGLSYEEAAQNMNVSKNTIKSNLRDAMIILKEKLNKTHPPF